MEQIKQGAKDLGNAMSSHPEKTDEAENKVDNELNKTGHGSDSKYVNKGANELEQYSKR